MTEQTQMAERFSLSLFPEHRKLVAEIMAEDHRSFSNAIQFVLEDRGRMRRELAELRDEIRRIKTLEEAA